jgi:hypothetical protein
VVKTDPNDPTARRPLDETPRHTEELPALPQRDRNIPAHAWIEAPAVVLEAGRDIGDMAVFYKRQIGPWLLWRAGPPTGAASRYVALHRDDLARAFTFDLDGDGNDSGLGPSGETHDRFRSWKEDLRDND